MRMLPFSFDRLPALTAGTVGLLLSVVLAGCASKNPLIDEPVAARQNEAQTTTTSAQTEPVATSGTATAASAGVQTTKQRRFLGFLSPYRPDIQQGNFVSKEMVQQLKEGMTREQVSFVLGTPTLTDIFHADRWDYPFRLLKGNGELTSSQVTVFFKDNRLVRFEGGDLPTEKDYLARLAGTASKKKSSSALPAAQEAPSSAIEPGF